MNASGDENACATTSRRLADRKVERFEKNIKKRGAVPETTTKKGTSYPVGPIVLGFFIFVVIGSYNPDSHKWRHGLNDEFTLLIVEYGSCRDVILLLYVVSARIKLYYYAMEFTCPLKSSSKMIM
ncbi:hypothetical protein CsSME_00052983 [Camellia sinensis var. sinensis]